MKKHCILASLASLALISFSVPSTVFAADVEDVISDGKVTFKVDQSKTAPKNPLDPNDAKPGTPLDPNNPSGKPATGTSGPLSLDFASSLSFGEALISTDDAKYYAKPQAFTQADGQTVDRPNFIQITDKRGTFEGWTLKVKQEKQFAIKDDASKELIGAQLKFLNANLISSTEKQYAPTSQASFELIPGSAQIAPVTAAKDQGMGTWVYRFGDEQQMAKSIELSVPGETPKMAKEYVTSLTWSLESTPANTTTPASTTKP